MSAVISDCGAYRYELWRFLTEDAMGPMKHSMVCWVMLNPSTADASEDDPTIRRVIGFSKQLGFQLLSVVNLFGLRATDPKEIAIASDPVGPDNRQHVFSVIEDADLVICAWGAHKAAKTSAIRRALVARGGLWALSLTRSGEPRHPLFLPKGLAPERWNPEAQE